MQEQLASVRSAMMVIETEAQEAGSGGDFIKRPDYKVLLTRESNLLARISNANRATSPLHTTGYIRIN